jgi:hypothetical protein
LVVRTGCGDTGLALGYTRWVSGPTIYTTPRFAR